MPPSNFDLTTRSYIIQAYPCIIKNIKYIKESYLYPVYLLSDDLLDYSFSTRFTIQSCCFCFEIEISLNVDPIWAKLAE